MTTIKPPSGIIPPATPSAAAQPKAAQQTGKPVSAPAQMPSINPEVVAEALRKYKEIRDKLKKQPFLAGASGLFTENVVFPSELLDPNDPANDPRYLHLLFAMFGLKELERYFATPEQEEETKKEEEEAKAQAAAEAKKAKKKVDKSPKKSRS